MDFILSAHGRNLLKERNIPEEWVERAVSNPDWEDTGRDDNVHYFKSITEHGGRILHVVVKLIRFHRKK